jgi:transcriptional regulator with XRE-family HTH domain
MIILERHTLYKDIGARLKNARLNSHLTQEQLAELMDVTPQMISTAENGTKGIRPENIIKFSKALNISCDFILMGHCSDYDTDTLISLASTIESDSLSRVINLLSAIDNYTKK